MTMKKFLIASAALALLAASAQAQMLKIGAKAGVTMLATDVKDVNAVQNDRWDEFKSKEMGWQAGLMARVGVPLTGLYVQPELMYNHASYQVSKAGGGSEKLSYGNIEMPVLLGFKLLFLNAHVGPTFTLAEMNGDDIYKVSTPDVGFQAGLGLTLKKVTLDLRYQGYFEKKWKEIDLSDVTQKLKANDGYWALSLGFFF